MGSKERTCGEKVRFRSHTSAMNFLGSRFMRMKNLATMRPYRCPYCERYHLGHYR